MDELSYNNVNNDFNYWLDFQRAEDNLMSNLPAVGFRVTGQTNIDDLPTIVKDSMVSKASKQLDSGKITLLELPKPILYCV